MKTEWFRAIGEFRKTIDLTGFVAESGKITLNHACYFINTIAHDIKELEFIDLPDGRKLFCWGPAQKPGSGDISIIASGQNMSQERLVISTGFPSYWRPLNEKATELAGKAVYGDAVVYDGYPLENT